jgi:hypothetical protein
MRVRKTGLALFAICASLLIVPVAASASTTHRAASAKIVSVKSFKAVPITGTSTTGKTFSGKLNVNHFSRSAGKTYAVGTLIGTIAGHHVTRSNVRVPVAVQKAATTSAATRQAGPSCPVLHLVLGPLTLNLLGLNVSLNQVVLNITATPGPGNLLGNLVCDVANLLNQSPAGGLAGLLNTLETALNNLLAGL